jgi:predicted ribosome-associated RNA-binding protein Tma20
VVRVAKGLHGLLTKKKKKNYINNYAKTYNELLFKLNQFTIILTANNTKLILLNTDLLCCSFLKQEQYILVLYQLN